MTISVQTVSPARSAQPPAAAKRASAACLRAAAARGCAAPIPCLSVRSVLPHRASCQRPSSSPRLRPPMLCACRARLCRAACTAAPRCLWLPLATHGCSLPPLAALAATANANANDAANANANAARLPAAVAAVAVAERRMSSPRAARAPPRLTQTRPLVRCALVKRATTSGDLRAPLARTSPCGARRRSRLLATRSQLCRRLGRLCCSRRHLHPGRALGTLLLQRRRRLQLLLAGRHRLQAAGVCGHAFCRCGPPLSALASARAAAVALRLEALSAFAAA